MVQAGSATLNMHLHGKVGNDTSFVRLEARLAPHPPQMLQVG